MIVAGCGSSSSIPNRPDSDQPGDDAGDQSTSGTGGAGGSGDTGSPDAGPSGKDDASTPDPDAGMQACGNTRCAAPLTCTSTGTSVKCECPAGYKDSNSDGSSCKDIDECADSKLNNCDDHASCTNHPGSYECACDGQAYKGSGKTCICADGYEKVAGECKAKNSSECEGEGDCKSGHCVSGICCATACDEPAVCQVADGATCAGGGTCVYPTADDDSDCDDDSVCTLNDSCQGGECTSGGDKNCGDGNVCTLDACDAQTGCTHDGTGITTGGCSASMCGTGWTCAGDEGGSCEPATMTDCSGIPAINDQCNVGACDPDTGMCNAMPVGDGTSCDDGSACKTGETCIGGSCGGGSAIVCDDHNPCTDDTCDPSLGCLGTNNLADCDDHNPCTLSDKCSGGDCHPGAFKYCGGQDDPCNVGVCNPAADAACGKSPRTNGTICDDGNSCSASSSCQGGTCTGSGAYDACGTPGTIATACSADSPNTCTCAATYHSAGGVCVVNGDECAGNPCDPNATCDDPSTADNNYVCTCNVGFSTGGTGTRAGVACTDINECAGNPCGNTRGICTQGAPGTYSCACNDPTYTEVGGTCVCDMNGVFAVRVASKFTWSNINYIENGTSAENIISYSYAIRTQSYDENGILTTETKSCGAAAPDLCGTGINLVIPRFANIRVPSEAYAQYVPNQTWALAAMPIDASTMSLPNALPTQQFKTADAAVVLGIHLDQPLSDTWPSSRSQVAAGPGDVPAGRPNNGAYWLNVDDGLPGITSLAVPSTGISANGSGGDDPPTDYGPTSTACPRSNRGTRLSYNYWPAPETSGLVIARRVSKFYSASRTRSHYEGSITSCDRIEGAVKGPGTTPQMTTDLRFFGCVDNSPDKVCGSEIVDAYDSQTQTQQVESASFIMKRWTSATAVTCESVRALNYVP